MNTPRKEETLVFFLAVRIGRRDNDRTKAMPSMLGRTDRIQRSEYMKCQMLTITVEENKAGWHHLGVMGTDGVVW